MHGRQTGLWVEIDRQYPVAPQREVLREMRRGGRLAAAALEVDDGDHLQLLAAAASGQVALVALAVRVEVGADPLDVLGGIGAPAVAGDVDGRSLAGQRQAAQHAVVGADQPRCLARRELPQRFPGSGREKLLAMRLQASRKHPGVGADQLMDRLRGFGRNCVSLHVHSASTRMIRPTRVISVEI